MDRNLYNFYETNSGENMHYARMGLPAVTPDWDDTVKITSRCTGLLLDATEIHGGREDCVDCNNHASGIMVQANWYPQGKYLATIKGGANFIALHGTIWSPSSEVDVDLGNWSDQSQEMTGPVYLNLCHHDKRPVTVRVLHALKPMFAPNSGPYEYVFPRPDVWYHGLVVKAFYLWCRLTK